jgi:hypothetical protein
VRVRDAYPWAPMTMRRSAVTETTRTGHSNAWSQR